MVSHQLAIVLVRGHHICSVPLLFSHARQCAYDIVSFIALLFNYRNPARLKDLPYIWNGGCDILGLLVALGLVFGIHFMAERMSPRGVETHGYVCRVLLAENFIKGVDKSEYR